MQQKIIRKVLAELAKETPDISYIKGLLEGIVEEQPVTARDIAMSRVLDNDFTREHTKNDEETFSGAAGIGPIAKLL